MASNNIQINIGSSFNGTGMEKAMGTVKNFSNSAKGAASAVGHLSQTLGGMGGPVSKLIGDLTGLTSALAMGGTVGIAIAGVTSLISLFKFFSEEADKAKKAQEKLFTDNLNKGINEYGKNLDTVSNKLKNVQTQQEKVLKSTTDLNTALTDKNVAQAQLNAINASAGASTGERGVIQAKANIDIARMKGQNSISTADANVQTSRNRLNNTNTTLGLLGDEIRALTGRIGVLKGLNEAYHKSAANTGFQDDALNSKAHSTQLAYNKATKKLAELQEKQAELLQQQTAQRNELKTAEEKAATARINADAANAKAQMELKDAEDKQWEEDEKAREESIKETWAEVTVRAERAAKMKEEERAEKKLRDTITQHEKDEKALDIATKELEDAQKDYATKLKNASIAQNILDGTSNGGIWNPNGVTPGGRFGPRDGASANNNDNAGFTDFAKPKGWDARWAQTHPDQAAAQGIVPPLSDKDQATKNRLVNKMANGGYENLSDSEKKEWDRIKGIDPEEKAREAEKKAEEARKRAEEAQKEKEAVEQKLRDDVSEILSLLQKLGLK